MATSAEQPDHHVVIVGAGFSGIGAAIALDRAGFGDLVVLERSDGVGGAWHANTYPGVAVDVPSFSYSFSFEQSARWSRVYAPGTELKAYAEHCVDAYGIRGRIRLGVTVTGAEFDDAADLWRLDTSAGPVTARHVVGASGVFTQPKRPDIAGLDGFAGPVVHTARWDHSLQLRGRRVAVVGTGASALQLIPAIAPVTGHLTVFQRTPIWVLPKLDLALPAPVRALLGRLPLATTLARLAGHAFVESSFVLPAHLYRDLPGLIAGGERVARRLLRHQVPDPELRDRLTPRYGLGCKRPSFSNTYLPTFNRPDVTLETAPIAEVTATGVRTAEGTRHDVDVLVLATGFKVFEKGNMPPFPVRGAGGVDLDGWWDANRYQAYHGASVPGFPNFFTILGPYGYNGTSYFQLIENQMRHIVRCLTVARRRGATRVEVTREANDRYFAAMLRRRERQVFFHNNCAGANSYYFDRHGDVPFLPATSIEAMWRSDRFDLDDYTFTRAVTRAAVPSAG